MDFDSFGKPVTQTKPEPVMSVDRDGSKIWQVNGLRHREDGPALITLDGNKAWYQNGLLHRIDGPAIEWKHVTSGEYWIHGKRITKEELEAIKNPQEIMVKFKQDSKGIVVNTEFGEVLFTDSESLGTYITNMFKS